MKKRFVTLFFLLGIWCHSGLYAQRVDPIPYYPMLNWDTSPYKSFRFTRPNASWEWINFRLLFPNGFDSTANDGTKYPLIIELHGAGESGRMEWNNTTKTNSPYAVDDPRRDNNDHHLLFGGREHLSAIQTGRFPGFVLFPQNSYGTWVKGKGDVSSTMHQDLEKAIELVEYLVKNLKVDPSRIYIHGLSAGGLGTWLAAYKRPDLFAAALPMSAPGDPAMAEQLKKLPLWVFQGELDTNPRPWATQQTVEAIRAAGGEVRYTEYAEVGHNTWNRAYREKDFFEWMLGKQRENTPVTPNQAPLANAGADKNITLPTNSTSFTGTASDPDGTIATYKWEKIEGPAATLSGTNSATLSLSNLVEGTYTFLFSVTDNSGAITSDEVMLIVNPAANQAPAVSAGTDKSVTLPVSTASFTAAASDPDGTVASYLWEKVSGPEVSLSGASSATVTANNLVEGVYIFKVTVTDNTGAKAWDEVQLTVNPQPNQAPTVSAGADKTITLPTNTVSFTAEASDPDGNIAGYLWEKVNGPAATLSGTTIPTLSLSDLIEGTYTFKVTVKDNKGATATDDVLLVVKSSPNQAPTVNAGADKAITLPTNTATIVAQASDPDGNIASYLWEKVNGPAATLSGANTATLSLSNLVEGTYTFKVTVTDNKGATAADDVVLVVNAAPNQAPTINAGADKSVMLPTNTATFVAEASDPDGNIASYLWEKVNGPAATLNGANTATLSLTGLVEGTYTFKVTVKDNKGATATDEVLLLVQSAPNQQPVVSAGADKAITLPTNSSTFTAKASDPDGTIANHKWEKVKGPAATLSGVNSATLSLADLVEGSYILKVTVTDNKGAVATDEVALIVNPAPNQAPTVNAGADKTITLPTNTMTFTAEASDPDGNIAGYLWEKVNGPAATLSGVNTATLSLSGLLEGTYTFKVTVTDNRGASASDEVQLKVNPKPNVGPTVDAGVDKTITLPPNSITLTATASDPDGNISSYYWEKVKGPAATFSGTTIPTLSVSDLMEGVYVFRVTVKDNDGAIASDEVQVTVKPKPNEAPSVNAGADQTITLPVNSWTVTANGTDPDGSISAYEWEKISGPAATLNEANTASLKVSALVEGTYSFKVTVTDNRGAKASDEVSLIVKPELNKAPVVNAGKDINITLPENTATVSAEASDPDGTISSYQWEKLTGPAATLEGAKTANLTLSKLEEGSYTFRVTVTDNKGATASDEVIVSVFAPTQGNKAPVVNVAQDTTVYLPLDFVVIKGVGVDNDGSISSYLWEKVSGPEVRIGYPESPEMELAGLEEGIYVFRLTVTDDAGASASAEMTLKVETMVNSVKPENIEAIKVIAYPNPFEDYIQLRVKSDKRELITVTMYDVLSKITYTGSFETMGGDSFEFTLDLGAAGCRSGVYFIQLQNQRGTYRELIKVVKK